ncbi:MAG: hypothetical protein LBO04_00335 [Spirochaetaceae bacterium]|nr:hypothetical protein [Spirochaetaceae bacterium]
MSRERGYVSPLLSNLASDWAAKAREGLVGHIVFPRFAVGKPTGKYATFSAEEAFKVPDVTMAGERSRANEIASSGKMEKYATTRYAGKSFIDEGDLQFMEGPFKLWEKRKTEMLVTKLELAQEKRIADKILGITGRSTTLNGTGAAAGKKWAEASDTAGGDPAADIRAAIAQCFFRPNLMVIPETVYDAIEFHPRLLDKLGEANLIKKVDEANLAKLFRIDRVIIAKGKADFGKPSAGKSLTLSNIWGNNVVLAYTSDIWDEPCAGKTVTVNYPQADNSGYVVRTWDEKDGGMLGGEYVQVGHDVEELVVSKNLIYSIKDVL